MNFNYPLELFEKISRRYPADQKSALTLPFLAEIQKLRGYIADEDVDFLAGYLQVPKIQIEEDISFYIMLRRTPIGKYHIKVCRNASCCLLGGKRILNHLSQKLKVKNEETTSDGKFTLSEVECLASCGTAPVMQINETYHENLTTEKVDAILENLP